MNKQLQTTQQAMALAAVFQAAEMVSLLASDGKAYASDMEPLMESILKVNIDKAEDTYGGPDEWRKTLYSGRMICISALDRTEKSKKNMEPNTLRYALSMVHLETKLNKNKPILAAMGQRIQQILRQREHFDNTMHPNMIAAMSGLYQDTISKLSYRIHVQGSREYLEQPLVSDQVRACLLAGIRAVILWRQLGGHRWHLLFKRRALQIALLESDENQPTS